MVEVAFDNIPEGPPLRGAFGVEENPGQIDLKRVRPAIPEPLPAPLDQPSGCDVGLVVRVRLAGGSEVAYGPCRRPPAIEALKAAMVRAARVVQQRYDKTLTGSG